MTRPECDPIRQAKATVLAARQVAIDLAARLATAYDLLDDAERRCEAGQNPLPGPMPGAEPPPPPDYYSDMGEPR